jgi:hypothetical protein
MKSFDSTLLEMFNHVIQSHPQLAPQFESLCAIAQGKGYGSATIVQELEVQHPAAKMLVLASKMQESESGDGTNLVVVLGGELLQLAESLLINGLPCSEIIAGYTAASAKCLEVLDSLVKKTYSVGKIQKWR